MPCRSLRAVVPAGRTLKCTGMPMSARRPGRRSCVAVGVPGAPGCRRRGQAGADPNLVLAHPGTWIRLRSATRRDHHDSRRHASAHVVTVLTYLFAHCSRSGSLFERGGVGWWHRGFSVHGFSCPLELIATFGRKPLAEATVQPPQRTSGPRRAPMGRMRRTAVIPDDFALQVRFTRFRLCVAQTNSRGRLVKPCWVHFAG